ncbi:EpsG family protein [Sporosarcina sp. SAFN-015]|uniref:EpsG family protein n=1 Tax=Sporosarcina sp. SAFN-015 TaxID=3387274 RepID=UPI003F80146B
MYNLFFFLLLYIILFIFIIRSQNNIVFKIFNILLLIFLTIMSGFRYNVGTDYETYNTWYYNWNQINIEWVYTGLSSFFLNTNLEFFHFTFFIAAFSNLILYIALKKWDLTDKQISLALILYSTIYIFLFMNAIRQGVAIILLLLALAYFTQKKPFKFGVTMVIAMGFHTSVLLVLPFIYLLRRKTISFTTFIIGIITSYLVIIFGFGHQIIITLLNLTFYESKYQNSDLLFNTSSSIFSLGVTFKTLLAIAVIYYVKEIKFERKFVIAINFYAIGAIFRIFALSTYLVNRVGLYFQFLELIVICLVIKKLKNKKTKYLLLFVIISVNIFLLYKSIVIDSIKNDYKYYWVFDFM